MTLASKQRLLDSHGIPYKTVNGRIHADSMISGSDLFEIVEDVTDLSRDELYGWLGY